MLETIVAKVRADISSRARSEWEKAISAQGTVAKTSSTFSELISRPGGQFIFEIKRKAPSSGNLIQAIDAVKAAQVYERSGAAAISVLTEGEFFGGSLDDLASVSKSVRIPTLRKDFIVDPLQIHEAAAHGAAAVLLIVAILDHQELRQFIRFAAELRIDALVEVHDEFELSRALAADARIIGVNNRNLKTMQIELATGERILRRIPDGVIRVAESGIRTRADVLRMLDSGAQACLVGTAVMRAEDAAKKIQELRGA
ncbi:MAG: indole-3-glycerol phosphate synthase TrpC [Candidatus Zixiibacteriota bacterium]